MTSWLVFYMIVGIGTFVYVVRRHFKSAGVALLAGLLMFSFTLLFVTAGLSELRPAPGENFGDAFAGFLSLPVAAVAGIADFFLAYYLANRLERK